jgi:DinB family protein
VCPAGTHYDYVELVDVRSWIGNDLDAVRSKLTDSILGVVPLERWVEQADGGGSSIAHIVFHVARHHDLAVTTAIRNRPPLFDAHCAALGLADAPSSVGLAEREDPTVTSAIPPESLVSFLDAVFAATKAWLDDVGDMALDTVPSTSDRLAGKAALSTDEVGWLYRMWADKAVWWLVQWPVIGHGHAHFGEAISVRNRMGLSPF